MTKLIVIPSDMQMIYDLVDKVDGYIIGINDMSVNLPCYFSLEQAIDLITYLNDKNKDIFISLNKNMVNEDIPLLEETIIKLDKYHLTGIMYYDIAIVNLKNKLNIKNDLVWAQEHMTTNYNTINYWYNEQVKYTYLSSEITKNEIIKIKKNTKAKLLVNVFGYLPIFTSSRHLIDNYLTHFKIKNNHKIKYMFKEDKTYPIIDNKNGTVVYSNYVLNGLDEYVELDIDYAILNSFLIDDFSKILALFLKANKNNKEEIKEEINKIIENSDEGFFIKETIYKVK